MMHGVKGADITPWLEYFVDGVLKSFQAVQKRIIEIPDSSTIKSVSQSIYMDERKRKLLVQHPPITFLKSSDLQSLFGIGSRAARNLATKWVEEGFLIIENPSKKGRLYRVIVNQEES